MKIEEDNRNLEDFDISELDEDQQYAYSLITRARSGKHSEFKLITNLEEFHDLRFDLKEAKLSSRQFRRASRILYKVYVKKLRQGMDDVYTLISSRNCADIADYWLDERYILQDIKDEYITYATTGHIMEVLRGEERSEEDMVDYRRLGELNDESREE